MSGLLASIPSPGSTMIGPFRAYGIMIALGVLAAIELSRRRYRDRGGDPDDIANVALVVVPAGLIGARLYHVITDWNRSYADSPVDALKIWHGGLGIPGAIAAGLISGYVVIRRTGMDWRTASDAIAPSIPLAQAIGRWGNWFNQELFGRPTDLAWGLEIDPAHRPARYITEDTFHPTFLYESLWNLALVGVLLLVDRKFRLAPGKLVPLYLLGYATGRLWVEAIRIDTASEIAGVRVNIWMSLAVIVLGAVLLVRGGVRRPEPEEVVVES